MARSFGWTFVPLQVEGARVSGFGFGHSVKPVPSSRSSGDDGSGSELTAGQLGVAWDNGIRVLLRPWTETQYRGNRLEDNRNWLGYVGTVAAAGLAAAGHEVLATDIERAKVDGFRNGTFSVFEPGLTAWIGAATQQGNLRFLQRDEFDGRLGEAALITVGTPPADGSTADLRQVRAAVAWSPGSGK